MAITNFDTSVTPANGGTSGGGNTGMIIAVIALGIIFLGIYLYTNKDKKEEEPLKQAA